MKSVVVGPFKSQTNVGRIFITDHYARKLFFTGKLLCPHSTDYFLTWDHRSRLIFSLFVNIFFKYASP